MNDVFDRLATEDPGPPSDEETPAAGSVPASSPPSAHGEPAGTPIEIKEVTQELLRHGWIEETRKPVLFRRAVRLENAIAAALEPLDLALRLDTHRGLALIVLAETACGKAEDDVAWAHPLVRRQRFTLEQSLLVALLRQTFVLHEQEAGVGESAAKIAVDDLLPQFLTYFDDSGSDARNLSRLSNLLDQLKTCGIVSEIDKNQEVTIRSVIAHLANPESLASLLITFREKARQNGANPLES